MHYLQVHSMQRDMPVIQGWHGYQAVFLIRASHVRVVPR